MNYKDKVPCEECVKKLPLKSNTVEMWEAPPDNCRRVSCLKKIKNKDSLFCLEHYNELKEKFTVKW
jgi:predicted amidophosphoribosyltransferase